MKRLTIEQIITSIFLNIILIVFLFTPFTPDIRLNTIDLISKIITIILSITLQSIWIIWYTNKMKEIKGK